MFRNVLSPFQKKTGVWVAISLGVLLFAYQSCESFDPTLANVSPKNIKPQLIDPLSGDSLEASATLIASSCLDHYLANSHTSGVYLVSPGDPDIIAPFEVYCEMGEIPKTLIINAITGGYDKIPVIPNLSILETGRLSNLQIEALLIESQHQTGEFSNNVEVLVFPGIVQLQVSLYTGGDVQRGVFRRSQFMGCPNSLVDYQEIEVIRAHYWGFGAGGEGSKKSGLGYIGRFNGNHIIIGFFLRKLNNCIGPQENFARTQQLAGQVWILNK